MSMLLPDLEEQGQGEAPLDDTMPLHADGPVSRWPFEFEDEKTCRSCGVPSGHWAVCISCWRDVYGYDNQAA